MSEQQGLHYFVLVEPDHLQISTAPMITPEVIDAAGRSVLCWLATVDDAGHPNVSPKEVFAIIDETHLAIAHIASPGSVRNIRRHPQVCVSFIDVFVQKGFKVKGTAHIVLPGEPDYAHWAGPLEAKAGPRFPIRAAIVVEALAVEPIVAPSYWLYPESTTEASQIEAAHHTYGVKGAIERGLNEGRQGQTMT